MRAECMLVVVLSLMATGFVIFNIKEGDSRIKIYNTVSKLRKRLPKCCQESTKECFACTAGTFVEDFCKRHQGEFGC